MQTLQFTKALQTIVKELKVTELIATVSPLVATGTAQPYMKGLPKTLRTRKP
jgi:hypothetical protein